MPEIDFGGATLIGCHDMEMMKKKIKELEERLKKIEDQNKQ